MRLGARESGLNPQPWPWTGPRILVEQPDAERADALVEVLRRAGYAVAVCPGPGHRDRCPLAGEDGCAAADGADAVVSGLGLATPERREVLAALRARVPETPLLVEAEAADAARWPELLDGCELVDDPAEPGELLARLRSMLDREAVGHA